MGKVYQAWDTKDEIHVAVKALRANILKDPADLWRFKRETIILELVKHENICQILDVGNHRGHPYYVMPLLRGISLAARMKAVRPLSMVSILEIFCQILNGLNRVHSKGIIHRDLKPSNIFLELKKQGRNYFVKILDFGVSRILHEDDALTDTGAILGTYQYMAPEQVWDSHTVDQRADLYSVGAMLYEALTGHRPFDQLPAESVAGLPRNPVALPFPSSCNPSVSRGLEKVVLKAMAHDPQDRYQTAELMTFALRLAMRDNLCVKKEVISKTYRWIPRSRTILDK